MGRTSKERVVARKGSRPSGAEQRLKDLGITLPTPPRGTPVELEVIFEVASTNS